MSRMLTDMDIAAWASLFFVLAGFIAACMYLSPSPCIAGFMTGGILIGAILFFKDLGVFPFKARKKR